MNAKADVRRKLQAVLVDGSLFLQEKQNIKGYLRFGVEPYGSCWIDQSLLSKCTLNIYTTSVRLRPDSQATHVEPPTCSPFVCRIVLLSPLYLQNILHLCSSITRVQIAILSSFFFSVTQNMTHFSRSVLKCVWRKAHLILFAFHPCVCLFPHLLQTLSPHAISTKSMASHMLFSFSNKAIYLFSESGTASSSLSSWSLFVSCLLLNLGITGNGEKSSWLP